MNLDRIHFKVQNDSLLILNQISELKKLNLLVRFDASLYSEQTINTGGKIRALNLKSVEQFKGLKPFNVLSETQLLDLYQIGVLENLDKYNFKINVSDLVSYNNRNFIVLGVVVNTYAQWNLPTPLLFNPNAMSNDVKSLYGSRLTEVQIVERINDNFQKGKYDNDIVIPLVDMAKPKDIISVVKPFITEKDTLDVFSKILKLKTADFEIKKDVFINTIADLKAEEIVSLKLRDEDLYNSFNLFSKSLNDIINKKIEGLPKSEKPKPARKPRAKKVVAPFVEKKLLTDLSNTKFWFGDNLELGNKVKDKAVEIGWGKIALVSTSDSVYFDSKFETFQASSGKGFFDRQEEREIFYEDLFGKEIPKTTSVEPEPILDELPDSLDVENTLVKDLPKGLFELTMFEAIKQGRKYADTKNKTLIQAIDWGLSTDGLNFWSKTNRGDLTEFKEKFGKNGEIAIKMYEDYMKKVASAKVDTEIEKPEVKTQEVKAVELLVFPPKGRSVKIRTESLYELHDISRFVLSKYKIQKPIKFTFNAITDLSAYTTQISFKENDSQDDILRNLLEQYDTFVKPELNWKNFDERQGDIDRMKENEKIVNSAFEVKVEKKPFFAPPVKQVEVEKPKPIKFKESTFRAVEKLFKPREIKIDKKKIEEKKKEIEQLSKAKPIKTIKPKITKPKEKDDLSFLDDLDNIF
jgi:hypothetical protein